MNSNMRHQLNSIKKGSLRVGSFIWDLLLIPSPFAPIMTFYIIASPLLIYLYLAVPSSKIGMDMLAADTGLPWFAPSVIFTICIIIGYQFRNPKANILLTLPMFSYAVVLISQTLSGRFGAASLLTTLFLFVSAWATLTVTRYYQELQDMKQAIKAIQQKLGVKDGSTK